MVAIEYDVIGVDLGHCVNMIMRRLSAASWRKGHAVEGHAFFQFGRENLAGFEENQVLVVVTEGVFGLKDYGIN